MTLGTYAFKHAFHNNKADKCAGCGVLFQFVDIKKIWKNFIWCDLCYQRRLKELPIFRDGEIVHIAKEDKSFYRTKCTQSPNKA